MLLWDEVGTALGNVSCSRGNHGTVLVVKKHRDGQWQEMSQ